MQIYKAQPSQEDEAGWFLRAKPLLCRSHIDTACVPMAQHSTSIVRVKTGNQDPKKKTEKQDTMNANAQKQYPEIDPFEMEFLTMIDLVEL